MVLEAIASITKSKFKISVYHIQNPLYPTGVMTNVACLGSLHI